MQHARQTQASSIKRPARLANPPSPRPRRPRAIPPAALRPTCRAGASQVAAEALAASPRIAIDTKSLSGSIALKGARLDDVSLKDYHETTDPEVAEYRAAVAVGSPEPYYVDVAYVAAQGKPMSLPKGDTLWSADGDAPHRDKPVTLSWTTATA